MHSNGINNLAIPVSPNSAKLSYEFLFPPLITSHVTYANICWPLTLSPPPLLDSILSKSLFHLIHCDVRGPSRVPPIFGFFYYIVFVDDFSRASKVYLFKDFIDVFPLFISFFQRSLLNISKTLKVLCTCNTLDFVKTALQDL